MSFFPLFSLSLFVSSSEGKRVYSLSEKTAILPVFLSPLWDVGGKVHSHLFSAFLLSLECLRSLLLFPLYAIIMMYFSFRDISMHRGMLTVAVVPRTKGKLRGIV